MHNSQCSQSHRTRLQATDPAVAPSASLSSSLTGRLRESVAIAQSSTHTAQRCSEKFSPLFAKTCLKALSPLWLFLTLARRTTGCGDFCCCRLCPFLFSLCYSARVCSAARATTTPSISRRCPTKLPPFPAALTRPRMSRAAPCCTRCAHVARQCDGIALAMHWCLRCRRFAPVHVGGHFVRFLEKLPPPTKQRPTSPGSTCRCVRGVCGRVLVRQGAVAGGAVGEYFFCCFFFSAAVFFFLSTLLCQCRHVLCRCVGWVRLVLADNVCCTSAD